MFNQVYSRSYLGNADGNQLNSTVVEWMHINPIRGEVTVLFTNGGQVYTYKNVSKRACIKFMLDQGGRSLGKFLNNVLKQERVLALAWD